MASDYRSLFWIVALIVVCGFGIYAMTRPQLCTGYWNAQHTVLYARNCHIDWSP